MTEPNQSGVGRLRTLYSIIPGVPSKKIDLSEWRMGAFYRAGWVSGSDSQMRKDQYVLDPECGTTACAIGLACSYPGFKSQGLSWDEKGLVPVYKYLDTSLGVARNWDAVCAFFEMEMCDAERIFAGTENGVKAKRLVMSRIRAYLLDHGVITQQRSYELESEENEMT